MSPLHITLDFELTTTWLTQLEEGQSAKQEDRDPNPSRPQNATHKYVVNVHVHVSACTED